MSKEEIAAQDYNNWLSECRGDEIDALMAKGVGKEQRDKGLADLRDEYKREQALKKAAETVLTQPASLQLSPRARFPGQPHSARARKARSSDLRQRRLLPRDRSRGHLHWAGTGVGALSGKVRAKRQEPSSETRPRRNPSFNHCKMASKRSAARGRAPPPPTPGPSERRRAEQRAVQSSRPLWKSRARLTIYVTRIVPSARRQDGQKRKLVKNLSRRQLPRSWRNPPAWQTFPPACPGRNRQ